VADEVIRVEDVLRAGEVLDPDASLVLRGSPLTVEGLLANAERTSERLSLGGEPFVAISVDVTTAGWDVDAILARRLGTRRSYAQARAGDLLAEGYALVPTFGAPHYSLVLPSYTWDVAARLIEVFGDVMPNPHFNPRRGS
jgi:hypothetical protein